MFNVYDNSVRERDTVVNIDSRFRQICPKYTYADTCVKVGKNPLEFTNNSNRIIVHLKNHPFKMNDTIILHNIVGTQTVIENKIFFMKDSHYIKIIYNKNKIPYNYFEKHKLHLQISGIVGNGIELNGIPINLINNIHEMLFTVSECDKYDPMNNDHDVSELTKVDTDVDSESSDVKIPNFYLIRVPYKADNNYVICEPVCLTFMHVKGIDIIHMNNIIFMIQQIIDRNKFVICCDKVALPTLANRNNRGGGCAMDIKHLIRVHKYYPYPNHYTFTLPKTFCNVKKVELVSVIFPNRIKCANNITVRFKLEQDGDIIYSNENKLAKRQTCNYWINKIKSTNIKPAVHPFFPNVEFVDIYQNLIVEINENISVHGKIYMKNAVHNNGCNSLTILHPFHSYTEKDDNLTVMINDICCRITKILDIHRYEIEYHNNCELDIISITYPLRFQIIDNCSNQNIFYYKAPHVATPDKNNYILMTNDILSNIINTGPVCNVFAKIPIYICTQNTPIVCAYAYDSCPKIFDDPYPELSTLEFKYFYPDGCLCDFIDDHSFCIKITEIYSIPINTHFSSHSGLID